MPENVRGPGGTAPATTPVPASGTAAPGAAFLHGGGELGALIRAKDWAQTPLGPPEAWPQSLKTALGIVLNSRYPMFVFWGSELIKIYNDGYRPITGRKHPWALGRPARETTSRVVAERRLRTLRDLATSTAEARTVGAACLRSTDVLTASAADVPFAARLRPRARHLHDDGRIVRMLEYAAPLLDEQGVPRGAVGTFVDITDRRRTEIRDSYLVALDDALRGSDDPVAIMAAASRLLATRLDADRCAYADVEADSGRFTIPHEHTRGVPAVSLVGTWTVSAFGPRAETELLAGQTLVIHDVPAELGPGTAFSAVGIAATIVVPALRESRLVAMMAVHSATPRRWRAEEIELVEGTTDRCWESLARARAARVVAASEARYRVVADAMPQLVWTADPDGVIDYYSARARAYQGIVVGTWQPMVHPDDVEPTVVAWTQALREQAPYAFEHRLQKADGATAGT